MMQLTSVIPPASWTIVMASGVVWIDLSADHQPVVLAGLVHYVRHTRPRAGSRPRARAEVLQ